LTLICTVRQPAFSFSFKVLKRPILSLCQDVTIWPFDCWKWKTMNHWHSVEADISHNLSVIVSSIIVVQMDICIIDNQYILSADYFEHPDASLPLTIWFTTTCVIWAIDDVAILCSSTCGRQFVACRSSHYFLINIAWVSHHSWCSYFSSISMTYHKQLSKSWQWGPGLSGELCSWMHGGMQHDACHAYRIVLRSDCSFYESYDITYLKVVGKFRDWLRFCLRT